MLSHFTVRVADLPCRYCNTMFNTDCAFRYHLEICKDRPAEELPQSSPAADAISISGTLSATAKNEPSRSPIKLRESPVKVQRESPTKNGFPEAKRIKTESASPLKRSLPSATPLTAPIIPLLPPPPPQPEVIHLDEEDNSDNDESK